MYHSVKSEFKLTFNLVLTFHYNNLNNFSNCCNCYCLIEGVFATFWQGTEMAWPHGVNDEGTFLELIVEMCRMQEPLITHFTTISQDFQDFPGFPGFSRISRISHNTLFGCMYDFSSKLMQPHATSYPGGDKTLGTRLKLMSHIVLHILVPILATSELRKRPGKSEVDNASWDCFRGRAFCLRSLKQSHNALSTLLLPGLLRNSEVANIEEKIVSFLH